MLYIVLWRLLTELLEYFDKHIQYLGKITLTEYVQGLSTCFNPLHVSVDYTTRVINLLLYQRVMLYQIIPVRTFFDTTLR